MKKPLIIIAAILVFVLSIHSQVKDSVYSGRVCVIVLTNGFEADGIITAVEQDTIWFRDEFGESRIPKSQIKMFRDLNQRQEEIAQFNETETAPNGTTTCDVYLETGTMLKDVKLLPAGDSNLTVLKGEVEKNLPIAGVRKLVFPYPGFGNGALIGAGIGFASGLLLGLTWPEHSEWGKPNFGESMLLGILFSIPTGLVGGVVGALVKTDDSYLLPPGYSITKAKRIKYIMQKHKQ